MPTYPMACGMRGDVAIKKGSPIAVQLTISSDPMAVRMGLQTMLESQLLQSLPVDGRGTAEIVLAEALNNIVEHAYANFQGEIDVKLSLRADGLACEISDSGLPMPGETLPEGRLAPMLPGGDLPEGGFGWFLIRTLAQDLCYRRSGGRNMLTFRLETEQSLA
jgi:serine/threonine-protein kinase RsbW